MSQNYYEILGVDPSCSQEEIKRAHRYKARIFHPDRMAKEPEDVRRKAEEDLKEINRAYNTLKDPQRRAQYDSQFSGQASNHGATAVKPNPIVTPRSITFKNLKPGETRKAYFTIQNVGGPYARIWFSNPNTWVRVVDWRSVNDSDELPLKVEVEVEADAWDKVYSEDIIVKLDDEETRIMIHLQTKPKPIPVEVKQPVAAKPSCQYSRPSPPPPTPSPSSTQPSVAASGTRTILYGALIVMVVILVIGLMLSYIIKPSPKAEPILTTNSQKTNPPVLSTQSSHTTNLSQATLQYSLLKNRGCNDRKAKVNPEIEVGLESWLTNHLGFALQWSGDINDIVKDPFERWKMNYLDVQDYATIGNSIWVVGDVLSRGYILHSNDNGGSWTIQWQDSSGFGRNKTCPFVVYFFDEKEGLVGSKDGIFYTQDGGENWRFSSAPEPNEHLYVGGYKYEYWFYTNERIVADIAYDKTYESLDGGKTWNVAAGTWK